jgi:hypothetical protein
MNFEQTPEFEKELKQFTKKWRTLNIDLLDAELAISKIYSSSEAPNHESLELAFFNGKRATRLQQTETCEVVKMRLDCASPGSQGLLRLLFIYIKSGDDILLVELYSKNIKAREDSKRIDRYVKRLEKQ